MSRTDRSTTPKEHAVADHRDEGPGENGTPVPRDLPDQQADAGQDPWDVDAPDQPEDETVPDTDEAGTGRQGAPHTAGANPDQPVPDEPSA